MKDTTTVKFIRSWRAYNPGERAGFTDDELDHIQKEGAMVEVVDTSLNSDKSKAKEENRKKLKKAAEKTRVRKATAALESGNYNKMRSTLSDLSDNPATGTKEDLGKRLEAIANDAG